MSDIVLKKVEYYLHGMFMTFGQHNVRLNK